MIYRWFFSIALLVTLLGCDSQTRYTTTNPYPEMQLRQVTRFHSDQNHSFELQVYYEPSAKPYKERLSLNYGRSSVNPWEISQANLEELFSTTGRRSVFVPHRHSEMHEIPPQNRRVWDLNALIELGQSQFQRSHQPGHQEAGVFFISGAYYLHPDVLGVHLQGFPFVFVFKDAIRNLSEFSQNLRIFYEQVKTIHEVGHMLGLVNNGLPLTSNHEDGGHPTHCSNPNCVMYWANEGIGHFEIFQRRLNRCGFSLVIFGHECLLDAHLFQ